MSTNTPYIFPSVDLLKQQEEENNSKKALLHKIITSDTFQQTEIHLPIALGEMLDEKPFVIDIFKAPHLLIAGSKREYVLNSINVILLSLLYKKSPSELKLVLIDPLTELSGIGYKNVITEKEAAIEILEALGIEMDRRYELLRETATRNINQYNDKIKEETANEKYKILPYIVVVISEFSKLTRKKIIECYIARLAQLARAVGIHLIIATGKHPKSFVSEYIKHNFPSFIALDTPSLNYLREVNQSIKVGNIFVRYNDNIGCISAATITIPEVKRIIASIEVDAYSHIL
jgi:ftsK/spoIIIE family protein